MKKNKMKLLISILLLLSITFSLVLTSCGSPSTLEDYLEDNKKMSKELKSYCSPGMTVDVKENTLTFTYAYEQTFIKETAKSLSKELKNTLELVSPTYIDVRDKLVEETGVEDITLVITYVDADGTVLCSEEY